MDLGRTHAVGEIRIHDRRRGRGNLPLDDEAGCKLALMFKLQERIKELDRVELLARRIDLA